MFIQRSGSFKWSQSFNVHPEVSHGRRWVCPFPSTTQPHCSQNRIAAVLLLLPVAKEVNQVGLELWLHFLPVRVIIILLSYANKTSYRANTYIYPSIQPSIQPFSICLHQFFKIHPLHLFFLCNTFLLYVHYISCIALGADH